MSRQFRMARPEDAPIVWEVLQQAIRRRKADGSNQWQDGYPNPEVVSRDIEKGVGFVLTDGELIVAYCAVLINDEPEYNRIQGKWLTNGDFVVVHRIAVSDDSLGKGMAVSLLGFIEEYALHNHIFSIRADTNFDNNAMLHIFIKLGFEYCGEVYFRGSDRKSVV